MGNIDSSEESFEGNPLKHLKKKKKKIEALDRKLSSLKNELVESEKRISESDDPKLEKVKENIENKISQLERKKQISEIEGAELQNRYITDEVVEMQVFFGKSEKEKRMELDVELLKEDRMEEFRNFLDFRLKKRKSESESEKEERKNEFSTEYEKISQCKDLITRIEGISKERVIDIEVMKGRECKELEETISNYEEYVITYKGYVQNLHELIAKQEEIVFTYFVYVTSTFGGDDDD